MFSRSRVIDEHGREVKTNQPRLQEGVHSGSDFIRHALRWGNVVTSSTVVVRRSAYQAVRSAFDTRFVVGYDQEMWVRLAARSPVGFLDVADVDYRTHADQATEAPVDCVERVRLLDHIESLLAEALPDVPFDAHFPGLRRAQCLLGAALDAAERGDAVAAGAYLRRARRRHPIALVHPAAPVVVAAGALGAPGRRALRRLRCGVRAALRPLETHEKAKAMGRPSRAL